MFVRSESFQTFIRLYPIVSSIVFIHIVFWFLLLFQTTFSEFLLNKMIGINALIFEGEYWRLFSSLFLHLHFGHMIVNSISLILFGPALENMLGKRKFIVSYIWSGMVANTATLFLLPPIYSHLGASGAIFGLFGVYTYLVAVHKNLIDRHHTQIIVAVLCIGFAMTIVNPNINPISHIFGYLGGTIAAPFVASHPKPYRR